MYYICLQANYLESPQLYKFQMAKNYSQRPHSLGKHSHLPIEPIGFKVENVIIDDDTKSPRLLSSYEKNAMRALTYAEKQIYYDYQRSKVNEGKEESAERVGREKKIEGVDKNQYRQMLEKKSLHSFGEFGESNWNKLKQFQKQTYRQEDNHYGLNQYHHKLGTEGSRKPILESSDPSRRFDFDQKDISKTEVAGRDQLSKRQSAEGSLDDSTARLVEKFLIQEKEEKAMPVVPTNQDLYFLINRQEKRLEDMQSGQEKILAMLEKISRNEQSSDVSSRHLHIENERLKEELRQSQLVCKQLEGEKRKLMNSIDATRGNEQSMLDKCKELEAARKEAQSKCDKLVIALKDYESKLARSEKRCKELEKMPAERRPSESIVFCSELAISNDITSFLREPIETITKRNLLGAKLLYQKDEWNTNISRYLQRPPFPVLILLRSVRGGVFGAFAEGIETYLTNRMKEEGTFSKPFRVFLFNATARIVLQKEHDRPKHVCGLSYHENYLKFGNNQLGLKNNQLAQMSFSGGSIFGEKYFNIDRRQQLTGEETDTVDISQLEIFQVFLQ